MHITQYFFTAKESLFPSRTIVSEKSTVDWPSEISVTWQCDDDASVPKWLRSFIVCWRCSRVYRRVHYNWYAANNRERVSIVCRKACFQKQSSTRSLCTRAPIVSYRTCFIVLRFAVAISGWHDAFFLQAVVFQETQLLRQRRLNNGTTFTKKKKKRRREKPRSSFANFRLRKILINITLHHRASLREEEHTCGAIQQGEFSIRKISSIFY